MPLDFDAVVLADSLEVQSVGAACQQVNPGWDVLSISQPTARRAFFPRFSLHTS